jgi:hypothetical protein
VSGVVAVKDVLEGLVVAVVLFNCREDGGSGGGGDEALLASTLRAKKIE